MSVVQAFGQASTATEALAAQVGASADVRLTTILLTVGLFAVRRGSPAAGRIRISRGLGRPSAIRAQRRASLKTGTADFARLDWLGVIPGMVPGSPLYQCLFDAAALPTTRLAYRRLEP